MVRSDRGNLSRPSVKKVYEYRHYVTEGIKTLLQNSPSEEIVALLEIGIHHEKQHQELLLTDIKYILGNNPLLPPLALEIEEYPTEHHKEEWIAMEEGIYEIGHQGDSFCYDNELGRHKVYLPGYEISNKLVTNQAYVEFINDGGYQRFDLWHGEGWEWVNQHKITAPLYWYLIDGDWYCYNFKGLTKLEGSAPVAHISYFEAFAFAQWLGFRLPTEFEWEAAQGYFPWGKRWEWTESAYLPYPNYQKADGALGEYNGKFMVNQKVLRGNSIATPVRHARHTYRNFFHPHLRWQFTGLRLAR